MVLILVRKVKTSLRGELSRWLMQPFPGVFLGHVSAIVREALWERCKAKIGDGGCILVYSWPNEQGLRTQSFGNLPLEIIDLDGLSLVKWTATDPDPEGVELGDKTSL